MKLLICDDHAIFRTGLLSALEQLPRAVEIEQVSGTLKLELKEYLAMLFLRQGRVIDVESNTPAPGARETLAELMTWSEAIFEFNSQAVEREDQIRLSTSDLLASLPVFTPDPASE